MIFSMKKKSSFLKIFLISIALILYILTAAKPIDRGLSIIPHWTVSITPTSTTELASVSDDEDLIPFKLGQRLGYITQDGRLAYTHTFPSLASINSHQWAMYGPQAADTPVHSAHNSDLGTIALEGYPYFTEHYNFVLLPGGLSFAKLTDSGSEAWRYEGIAPITSFTSSATCVTAGYADGRLVRFNAADGTQDFAVYPQGSNYQIILGAASSDSGLYTACVSGIDEQRVVLYQFQNGQNTIIWHQYLKGNLREPTLVQFSEDEKHLYFAESTGLAVTDTVTLQTTHIPLHDKIIQICELPEQNLTVVLEKGRKTWTVDILEDSVNLLGSFSFESENASIHVKGNALYVGRGDTITKLEIER